MLVIDSAIAETTADDKASKTQEEETDKPKKKKKKGIFSRGRENAKARSPYGEYVEEENMWETVDDKPLEH